MTSDYNCLLCGVDILSGPPSKSERWLCEYRIVYRNGYDVAVTGVGAYDDLSWKPPIDPLLRWDNEPETNDELEIPVMLQSSVDGTHGYVIHDACWSLLQTACQPAVLSLERFLCACESLPFPLWSQGVCWGHDYGGLLEHDVEGDYPWTEHFSYPPIRTAWDMGVWDDPFHGSDVCAMLSSRMSPPPETQPIHLPMNEPADDPFSRLPWELCEMILMNMPLESALNMRLVSRVFLPLFSSLAFWSSRFEPDGEMGFLFEARESEATFRDVGMLVRLYQNSRRSVAAPGLMNRKRVYGLARMLCPLVEQPPPSITPPSRQPRLPDSEAYIRLAALEHPSLPSPGDWKTFYDGCRPTTTVSIEFAPGPVTICIALVDMGVWDYVTGMRIVDHNGNERVIGHTYNKTEKAYHVAALHGFRVAMGQGGVRALQVIGSEQRALPWAGRVEGVPQSQRLALDSPVTSLELTLDGYKVTAISVRSDHSDKTDIAPPLTTDLRHDALWYPTIPPDDWVLNQASFTGQNPFSAGYQPLSWIHFGGPSGKSMAHVRGVLIQSSHSLRGLQFIYDEEHGQRYSDKLGRRKESSMESRLFPIDGAGGERIESVHAGIRRYPQCKAGPAYLRHGMLECIKMTTNLGRTLWMGEKADDLDMKHVGIADGTVITGFYGQYVLRYGLISLGVISEHIEDL